MPEHRPLILTARLDPATFARLQVLRQAHFPPALNRVPAHLTMFHKLPGDGCLRIIEVVRALAPAPCPIAFARVRFLGRGVAFDARAPGLQAVRARVAEAFNDVLTAQDRQKFHPHVTIQNKADPITARRLFEDMAAGFTPWSGLVTGITVWRYEGGPWSFEADIPFESTGREKDCDQRNVIG